MTRKRARKAAAANRLQVVSPIDGSIYAERELATSAQLHRCLRTSREAAREWARTPVSERARLCAKAARALLPRRDEIALEITYQMGRPLRDSMRELDGVLERALYMTSIAETALADIVPDPQPGFRRFIRREPLGVVLAIAPWNYPYLTAINVLVPALTAGNSVILKHSPQTPLCAERLGEAMQTAGLPDGVFQFVHCDHAGIEELIRSDDGVDFVAFTGSVEGGHAIQSALAPRFIGSGLELGGKDPAYVRADADPSAAADGIVDGAIYNAGQSCCAVERCYVHESVYDAFVREALERIGRYRLGDPRDLTTTLGPLVRAEAAARVRARIDAAVRAGARAHVPESSFPESRPGTAYLAPQLLTEVDPSMALMREETFGPVLCVARVRDDADAIARMNDSRFGLTASIWTFDLEAAERIGQQLETGTVFMNRCDYLDPALAWTGVKDSGRGCSLSRLGYEVLTRPKSFHLRF